MSTLFSVEDFKKSIEHEIKLKIEDEIEIIINDAKLQIEKKVRESSAGLCAKILTYFNYRMDSHGFYLTVDFKNLSEQREKDKLLWQIVRYFW